MVGNGSRKGVINRRREVVNFSRYMPSELRKRVRIEAHATVEDVDKRVKMKQ